MNSKCMDVVSNGRPFFLSPFSIRSVPAEFFLDGRFFQPFFFCFLQDPLARPWAGTKASSKLIFLSQLPELFFFYNFSRGGFGSQTLMVRLNYSLPRGPFVAADRGEAQEISHMSSCNTAFFLLSFPF